MQFTYKAYHSLLQHLNESGYSFADYHNWSHFDRCVVLRHDIDYDIPKAVKMAEIEQDTGVQSVFFVLLTSDFYNVFSKETSHGLKRIADAGHQIGLHFDEARYPECAGNVGCISELIQKEAEILGHAIGESISVVSMHRPSKGLLESNLEIPGLINSYNRIFFSDFKYLSDSRRRWREAVDEIIESREYKRIHLLTHAFWYNDEESDLHDSLRRFIQDGSRCRYDWLRDNITDLESVVSRDEFS